MQVEHKREKKCLSTARMCLHNPLLGMGDFKGWFPHQFDIDVGIKNQFFGKLRYNGKNEEIYVV